jgi:hypothetical protein
MAWPLAARGQPADRVRRIGWLHFFPESDPGSQVHAAAFRQGMEKLGWFVGRNLATDYRWGAFNLERVRVVATELLGLAPTKFSLTINAKTAKALGLTVPDKLIVAADEIFE